MDGSQDKQITLANPAIKNYAGSKHRAKKKLLVSICVLVILLLAAGATVLIVNHYKQGHTSSGKSLTPEQQAANLQVTGNYAAAQKIYDTQLKKAVTNQAKANAYTGKSSIYITSKDYTDALAYAKKADQLEPTPVNAESLGGIEELLGNKAAAASYYKLAIKRLDPKSPVYSYQLSQVQNMLKQVTQQ